RIEGERPVIYAFAQLPSVDVQGRLGAALQLSGNLHQQGQVGPGGVQGAAQARRLGVHVAGGQLALDGGAEQGNVEGGYVELAAAHVGVELRFDGEAFVGHAAELTTVFAQGGVTAAL